MNRWRPIEIRGLLQRRQVVAAVVHERRRVLEHNLVVVWEPLGAEQVALAENLDAFDAELLRREVEQALAHEDAVLRPAPRTGVTMGLFVNTDVNSVSCSGCLRAQQRALGIDWNRQPVRIVRARIAQKPSRARRESPVVRQRHLRLVHLSTFLRRRVEVLLRSSVH